MGKRKKLEQIQQRILELVADGMSNKEIAKELNFSVASIDFKLQRLLYFLAAKNRAELVAIGFRNKLLK